MFSAIYRCSEYLRLIRDEDVPSLWQSLSTGRTIPCLPETFALNLVGDEVRLNNIVIISSCFHLSISMFVGIDISLTWMPTSRLSVVVPLVYFVLLLKAKRLGRGGFFGKLHYL